MKTIYKYQVKENIDMPKGAEILSVGTQNGVSFLWALVHPDAEIERRHFVHIATGGLIQPLRIKKFIGTIFEDDAIFVWHVFEINK